MHRYSTVLYVLTGRSTVAIAMHAVTRKQTSPAETFYHIRAALPSSTHTAQHPDAWCLGMVCWVACPAVMTTAEQMSTKILCMPRLRRDRQLAFGRGTQKLTLHLVPHTHDDLGWYVCGHAHHGGGGAMLLTWMHACVLLTGCTTRSTVALDGHYTAHGILDAAIAIPFLTTRHFPEACHIACLHLVPPPQSLITS